MSASATTPAGTDDSAINSASGTLSPPSRTVGIPDAFRAASPPSQARLPPSSRTTAMSAPSRSAGSSPSTSTRVGFPIRYAAPVAARAANRSVSAVDNNNTVLMRALPVE
ncbi:hypothetical protein RKD19_006330 [Streptomyces canus]